MYPGDTVRKWLTVLEWIRECLRAGFSISKNCLAFPSMESQCLIYTENSIMFTLFHKHLKVGKLSKAEVGGLQVYGNRVR